MERNSDVIGRHKSFNQACSSAYRTAEGFVSVLLS